MTETKSDAPKAAALPMGGQVLAVVPQTFEDIQRVATQVIYAGIAPAALVKFPSDADGEEERKAIGRRNVAAVAAVLMAGAELGVPPMAALRMFTVINGRPALYGDGNVAVVRKARDRDGELICDYIRQGFERGADEESTVAWCEARRRDNQEVHREEFSIADAKRAGLWDDKEFKRARVWRDKPDGRGREQVWADDVPNDSVWHRYPKRMMLWRATGYCLRWLFADVLGGMLDEHEAREIEGMIDITPAAAASTSRAAPAFEAPEPPPEPPAAEDQSQDAPEPPAEEKMDPETGEFTAADTSDVGRMLSDVDTALQSARTEEDVNRIFTESEVEGALADDDGALTQAYAIRTKHLDRVERIALAEQGQGSMFPGDE